MIEFRQKEFVGLQDGFGGKLGRIKRSGKKSDSYKNFGPWEVSLCDSAKDEYMELNDKDMDRVDKIMKKKSKLNHIKVITNSTLYGNSMMQIMSALYGVLR